VEVTFFPDTALVYTEPFINPPSCFHFYGRAAQNCSQNCPAYANWDTIRQITRV